MKKIFMILIAMTIVTLTSCGGNWSAEINQQREAETARLQSTYAKVINKLEMSEGNFQDLRRIVLYNVRMDTTVVVETSKISVLAIIEVLVLSLFAQNFDFVQCIV